MTVEGIGRQIYPGLDLVEEVKPYFSQLLGYRYSPERLTSDLLHMANRFSTAAGDFPSHAGEILEDIRMGRLKIEVRQPSVSHAAERLGRRVFAGAVVGAMLLSGAILLAANKTVVGAALLGTATLWTFLHGASLALTRNRPPR
jgi:ubiquinone biosynthesis protein